MRAIRHGLRFGAHGLPLMGSGDWNDGMNLVGAGGKGESVWLAFFLYRRADAASRRWRARAATRPSPSSCDERGAAGSREHIEAHGWDGDWYRRAYFDDGTPLGSAANAECQIDSIAQSWAVLSGAAPTERARDARWTRVDRRLVRARHRRLIQLLDPPFDTSRPDPGYIKGYVPGRARERRPVHARRDLGGDGLRGARRRRARLGALRA